MIGLSIRSNGMDATLPGFDLLVGWTRLFTLQPTHSNTGYLRYVDHYPPC